MAHSLTKTPLEKESPSSSLFLRALGLSFILNNPLFKRNSKIKQEISRLAIQILKEHQERNYTLWQYRPDLPSDLDTSSLYIFILSKAGKLTNSVLADYLITLRNHRTASGGFYTWINLPPQQNEIDVGVNLNIQLTLREMGARDLRLKHAISKIEPLYYSESFIRILRQREGCTLHLDFQNNMEIFCDKDATGKRIWIYSRFVDRCIELHNKSAKLCTKIQKRRQEKLKIKIERMIMAKFSYKLTALASEYPAQAPILDKFLNTLPKLEKNHGIISARVELFTKNSLKQPINACLGALYGWTTFTLADDLVDEAGISATDPYLLIHLINKSIEHFSLSGVHHKEISRVVSISSLFSHHDTCTRNHSHRELIEIAWKKSFAQTIGLLAIGDPLTYQRTHLRFWKRYTLIKQLNDDLHDITEDIRSNKQTLPASVYSFLYKHKTERNSNRALYRTIQYFSKVLAVLCTSSLNDYHNLPLQSRAAFWRREIEKNALGAKRAPIELIKLLHLRKEIQKYSRIN